MELSPIDILHTQFKRSMRGYSRSQVDAFLREAAATLEGCAEERAELREKVERLTAEVKQCRDIEATMNNALVLAQKTADDLKANAHREAEVILREAEQESSQRLTAAHDELAALKNQIRALKGDRDKFESEFRALIRSCSDWLDRQTSDAAEPSGEED